jgi:cytochrome c peroxidase
MLFWKEGLSVRWTIHLGIAATGALLALCLAPRGPIAASEPTDAGSAVKAADPSGEKPATKPAKGKKKRARTGDDFQRLPLGLPKLPVPADNPMTKEKVELGKMLYFDKRVSKDGTISCATCHDPQKGWAEHDPTSTGIRQQKGGRNSPTVINAAYATAQFWDGRAPTLEAQAVGPVANPIEMGHSMDAVVENFSKIPGYQARFQKVFGTGVTEKGFAQAIAAFERTVLSGDSPYDQFKAGKKTAMSDTQQRGMKTFEKAGCANCHEAPMFSNYKYDNAGVGIDGPKPDEGRKAVTKEDEDMGAFRVPSLRDVASTAPYFHDGSAKTLDEAVALMAAGGNDNPHRSGDFDAVREAKLTAQDQKDIVEFLKALSGKYPIVQPPALPE